MKHGWDRESPERTRKHSLSTCLIRVSSVFHPWLIYVFVPSVAVLQLFLKRSLMMRPAPHSRFRGPRLACLAALLAMTLAGWRLWPGEASAQAPGKEARGRPAARAVV